MFSFLPTFALSVLTPGRSPHAVQAPALHASSQLPMQAAPLTSRRELIVQAGGLAVAAAAAPVYAEAGSYPKITVATTAGTMEFELWDDVAPGHVKNMLTLAKQGFFDGGAFHRIIPGFVVQVRVRGLLTARRAEYVRAHIGTAIARPRSQHAHAAFPAR